MNQTVMLVGLGGLGSTALQLLACMPKVKRIVVASRNKTYGSASCNHAIAGAMAQGFNPEIKFTPLDLYNVEEVAQTVHREKPGVIFNTATMLSPWVSGKLPPEQAIAFFKAGFGIWLPVHLALSIKLMEALRQTGFKGFTLTAPFPDVVNCILKCLNLAPSSGIGNVDLYIPKIRMLSARRLGVPPEEIHVKMVAHHALMPTIMGVGGEERPPYYLIVEHNGDDVTEAVSADELIAEPYDILLGPETNFITAGSGVRLIQALLSENETHLHAPAPMGLPGGYPVTASRRGIQLSPIRNLTQSEAITINEKSHRFDGIERIETDGTAVFKPASAEIMRETLGYDCERLQPMDAEERAVELISRLRECARKQGVDLQHTV